MASKAFVRTTTRPSVHALVLKTHHTREIASLTDSGALEKLNRPGIPFLGAKSAALYRAGRLINTQTRANAAHHSLHFPRSNFNPTHFQLLDLILVLSSKRFVPHTSGARC